MNERLRQAERAADAGAMRAPQAFPLIGDGEETRKVIAAGAQQGVDRGPDLAEARYRDWQAEQARTMAVAA